MQWEFLKSLLIISLQLSTLATNMLNKTFSEIISLFVLFSPCDPIHDALYKYFYPLPLFSTFTDLAAHRGTSMTSFYLQVQRSVKEDKTNLWV